MFWILTIYANKLLIFWLLMYSSGLKLFVGYAGDMFGIVSGKYPEFRLSHAALATKG